MAKVTLIFAILLIALGLGSYFGTGSQHLTALIPAGFGLILGILGLLAMSPDAGRRKLYMHVNVTIGLLGFLMAGGRAIISYGHARSAGIEPDRIALGAQGAMAGLLLIYVLVCVRSFIEARRSRLV